MVGMSISAQFARTLPLLRFPTSVVVHDLNECIGDLPLVENHMLRTTFADVKPVCSYRSRHLRLNNGRLSRWAAISSLDGSREKLPDGALGDRTDHGVLPKVPPNLFYLHLLCQKGMLQFVQFWRSKVQMGDQEFASNICLCYGYPDFDKKRLALLVRPSPPCPTLIRALPRHRIARCRPPSM
jgi:hypothetical protein